LVVGGLVPHADEQGDEEHQGDSGQNEYQDEDYGEHQFSSPLLVDVRDIVSARSRTKVRACRAARRREP
jgi:hypothetical protein